MLKKLLCVATLAVLTGAANAQITGYELGYCDGQVKTSGTDGFSIQGEGNVSAAIYIPASMAKAYAGCEINEIKVGLASTLNVDNVTAWVRDPLDSFNITEGTISKTTTPKIAKGWNTVTLEDGLFIPESPEGFYLGITIHQTGTAVGLSVVQGMPVAEGSLFVKLGDDAEWVDRSAEGILALEGIVSGENLPMINLTVKDCFVNPNMSLVNNRISGNLTIRNNAATTVTGFDILCTIDDDTKVYTIPADIELAYKQSTVVPFTFEAENLAEGEHTLNITVANILEGEDAYMSDNTISGKFNAISKYYQRNVLVEEFSTELCSNCPRIAGWMHEMLEDNDIDSRVNVICHHAGYNTDWLTIPADKTYLWLYATAGVFAPAMLIDRVTAEGISTQDPKSPIFFPNDLDHMRNTIKKRMEEPAFVYLDMEVTLTDGNAHVKVSGERAIEEFTINDPRIVVALVEDNIPANQQFGPEGVVEGYVQQHVNRFYNSTWGENLTFDGDNYSYECDLAVDPKYVKENLVVTAYIWDYNPTQADKCEISNSNRVRYAQMIDKTSGVETLEFANSEVEYFNLQGIRLSEPANGINIVRKADGTVGKVLIRK